jgi:hypothetical protein
LTATFVILVYPTPHAAYKLRCIAISFLNRTHLQNTQIFKSSNRNMSDAGRKDWSTKAGEEITPDSSKSTLDKTKENVTDATDRVAGETQSDSSKGVGQSAFDKGKREKHGSMLDSVKVSFLLYYSR